MSNNQYLKLRRSAVPGKVPDTSSLDFGEIAINTYDGLLFIKKSGSLGEEVISVGSNVPSSTNLFQITTGSVTASVDVRNQSIFLIKSSSRVLVNVDNTGSIYTSGSLKIDTSGSHNYLLSINNNQTQSVLINGEGVLVLYQYSTPPTPVSGGLYMNSTGEFYIGV